MALHDIDSSKIEDGELSEKEFLYLRDRGRLPAEQLELSYEEYREQHGGSTDAEGYEAMDVDDLKEELRSRGLKVSGTKPELVARLEEDDDSDEDE